MNISSPENFEINILSNVGKEYNEMTDYDRRFLNGVIRQIKPKKILELGVAAGGSSAIILNAIKDIDNAHLYSIDYNTIYWKDLYNQVTNPRKTGFILNEKYNNLLDKHTLYTGGLAAKYLDEIGDQIDLCLLDTAHSLPGECLDFLMILPYLKNNAVIVMHDVLLYSMYKYEKNSIACGILFSSLKGKKSIVNANILGHFGNICAIVLDNDIKDRILDYFHLLTLPWNYLPTNEDMILATKFLSKFYDQKYIDMLWHSYLINKERFLDNSTVLNNQYDEINYKLNAIIDSIAWWIPIKKWRKNFRNKFTRPDQTRPDQTRPDQTRPNICINNNINNTILINKLQPTLQI